MLCLLVLRPYPCPETKAQLSYWFYEINLILSRHKESVCSSALSRRKMNLIFGELLRVSIP